MAVRASGALGVSDQGKCARDHSPPPETSNQDSLFVCYATKCKKNISFSFCCVLFLRIIVIIIVKNEKDETQMRCPAEVRLFGMLLTLSGWLPMSALFFCKKKAQK